MTFKVGVIQHSPPLKSVCLRAEQNYLTRQKSGNFLRRKLQRDWELTEHSLTIFAEPSRDGLFARKRKQKTHDGVGQWPNKMLFLLTFSEHQLT